MKNSAETNALTERLLIISLLNAFKPFEILIICACLTALASLAIYPETLTELLAASALLAGFAALFIAFRIRVDVGLYTEWDKLDIVELDQSLQKIRPTFQTNRSLDLRLKSTIRLLKFGIVLTFIQCLLLAILAGTGTA